LSFSNKIELLTKVLYDNQRKHHAEIELDPIKFCQLIEENEPKLKGFFDEMINIIPDNRTFSNKESAKKAIVGYCYLLAGLRNKFVNNFKLDLGLYLSENGTSAAAIDTLSNAGMSASYKTIDNYKKKIKANHPEEIRKYFTNNVS
jgi:hypothetical protein